MNKLTKIGVSALCGSLASVASAQAGSLDVTGGATATYVSLDGETTGNPFGMASSMTFKGSGELDNGSTFSVSIAHTDKAAYTGSAISLTTPTLGTFKYDEGGGTGLDRIDDMMPTAWEEVDGTGLAMGLQTVSGAGGSSDIEWSVGSDMLQDGMNVYISYNPMPDGSKNTDKSVSGTANGSGQVNGFGWDVVVTHSGLQDGLNVFGGYSVIEQIASVDDRIQYALGATYAVGGITIGYQYSKDDNPAGAATADFYENNAYGISFSVNDNLSISLAQHESDQVKTGNDVSLEGTSLQAAYTVGGASIKFAETSVDNKNYSAGTNKDGRSIALTLAF
jgi:hypothetical protein